MVLATDPVIALRSRGSSMLSFVDPLMNTAFVDPLIGTSNGGKEALAYAYSVTDHLGKAMCSLVPRCHLVCATNINVVTIIAMQYDGLVFQIQIDSDNFQAWRRQ